MAYATDDERYFLSLVNATRAEFGLSTFKLETRLNLSADRHTAWMLDQDVFSHTGVDGSSSSQRMQDAGFDFVAPWRSAENLAYISVDSDGSYQDEMQSLHENLMNSPGHRANLLNPDLDYIGIGFDVGAFMIDGVDYPVAMVTQNFASTAGEVILDIGFEPEPQPQPEPEPEPEPQPDPEPPAVYLPTAVLPDLDIARARSADWSDANARPALRGDNSSEVLLGSDLAERVLCYDGDDKMRGYGGDDWISGQRGNDTVLGGDGDDALFGNAGDDRLYGQDGNDILFGGASGDTLYGGAGADNLHGSSGRDRLIGGAGDDKLAGGAHSDKMFGDSGNDTLRGDYGNDRLLGGSGRDVLVGGGGNDVMSGGSHGDSFVFTGRVGQDRIIDFEAGYDRLLIEGDLIGEGETGYVKSQIDDLDGLYRIGLSDGSLIDIENAEFGIDALIDSIFII